MISKAIAATGQSNCWQSFVFCVMTATVRHTRQQWHRATIATMTPMMLMMMTMMMMKRQYCIIKAKINKRNVLLRKTSWQQVVSNGSNFDGTNWLILAHAQPVHKMQIILYTFGRVCVCVCECAQYSHCIRMFAHIDTDTGLNTHSNGAKLYAQQLSHMQCTHM